MLQHGTAEILSWEVLEKRFHYQNGKKGIFTLLLIASGWP